MRHGIVSGISTPFGELCRTGGQVVYVLLTLSPLYSGSEDPFLVRLACLIHAASVRSEPVSYPSYKAISHQLSAVGRLLVAINSAKSDDTNRRPSQLRPVRRQGY